MIEGFLKLIGSVFVFAFAYMFSVVFFGFLAGFVTWDFSIIVNNIFPWYKENISYTLRIVSLVIALFAFFGFLSDWQGEF